MILLLAAQAAFIGSQACAACHAEIFRQYKQTPMAQSSGPVESLPPGMFRHDASGIEYHISGRSIAFERPRGIRGQREVQYYIGSGAAGRSYLFQQDGYLFQAPVTWYAQSRAWDISPGQEQDRRMRWTRPIETNCLYCHASRPRAIYGSQNCYDSPPFAEGGVACERCHGPAELHVKSGGPIVNPAKLPATERDDVCAQCHLTGEARINLTGKQLALYQPGATLGDYVSFFVYENIGRGLKATSHVEKLAGSRCKRQSGDRLWCGTCHNPHGTPSAAARASWYRQKCLGCHEAGECTRGEDCVGCHMPRARVVGGGHGVLTDHSIPRRASEKAPARSTPGRRLVAWPGSASDARLLGLAYAEVALETGDPFHEKEAFRLLREALPSHSADSDLLTRLAWLYQKRGESERAAALYEAALKVDRNRTVAKVNLGTIYARAGHLQDAIELWHAALRDNPGLTEAAMNLAAAWRALRQEGKATAVLRELMRYDPEPVSLSP